MVKLFFFSLTCFNIFFWTLNDFTRKTENIQFFDIFFFEKMFISFNTKPRGYILQSFTEYVSLLQYFSCFFFFFLSAKDDYAASLKTFNFFSSKLSIENAAKKFGKRHCESEYQICCQICFWNVVRTICNIIIVENSYFLSRLFIPSKLKEEAFMNKRFEIISG